ncbi:Phosphodiest-domain-containing protein [Coniophora puteana RWD-64-598 SS2]|uniref:Phosphodiest-domain-containing protein n=1 Tax=Coniophora puteana (strain RWD-64-598) TaxID=741705 RepID=R7SG65_CONPW|nr:Phosphodiest-domain-containing protein [Coniophora puteana RWD-64-598 SS2]EIW74717.1 Phosphodiest-domain-containing protein [Coniophora puteana RWD-64-598 SS2]
MGPGENYHEAHAEEIKALLSDDKLSQDFKFEFSDDSDRVQDIENQQRPVTPRRCPYKWKGILAATLAGLSLVFLSGCIHKHASSSCTREQPCPQAATSNAGKLFNNGTHDFKRTVVMVSIDGLRADYLDRGFTPHLLDISKKGLRAKYMKPIFPTLTFPNHWALMTGLHAESHGIVANNFYDPVSDNVFAYNKPESCWNSSWWYGEPMWETAEKAGITTANLMWPGPPVTSDGGSSTYFIPWRDHVPLREKLDQILTWVDLPVETRPQLVLAYEPSLDQAGHLTGPLSLLVNTTLAEVDVFAKELQESLADRNLTDIVDIIFVSDHGMTDTSHPEWFFIDDILGDDINLVEHSDGWPSMGLRFKPEADLTRIYDILYDAASKNEEKFEVFTHETMPERYHFSNNYRIAPIYVVPKEGYALATHSEDTTLMSKGNHGYDNENPSMHAMFVAHGPFSFDAKATSLSSRSAEAWHSVQDDAYVMPGFPNVEIYNLIMRLLDVDEQRWAPTNGTDAFWDAYLPEDI